MEKHLDHQKWSLDAAIVENDNIDIHTSDDVLYVSNTGTEKVTLAYGEDIAFDGCRDIFILVKFLGKNLSNGGGCLYINNSSVTLNGMASIKLKPPINLHMTLEVPSRSAVEVNDIVIETKDAAVDLSELCAADKDVLVISPGYPSTQSLYSCAFAHSRNREYVN